MLHHALRLFLLHLCMAKMSHDLILGQPYYGDYKLFEQTVYKYGIPLLGRKSSVTYRTNGQTVIMLVLVKDHFRGNGGSARITSGGLNRDHVTVLLFSGRGEGFNFTVSVYGRHLDLMDAVAAAAAAAAGVLPYGANYEISIPDGEEENTEQPQRMRIDEGILSPF